MNQLQKTTGQGLTPFETSDKNLELKNAIKSGLTIRKIQDDEPIKQSLRFVFLLIGLKGDQIPEEVEKAVLLKFIRENFANLNPEEIRIAFELALKGEFEVDLNHFGSFSSMYLSRVLKAYQNHRSKIVLELEKERQREERESPKQPSEEELKQIQLEFDQNFVQKIFDIWKTKKILDLHFASAELVFKSVERFVQINEEQRKVIREQAKERLENREEELRNQKANSLQGHKMIQEVLSLMSNPERRPNFYREYCFEIAIEKAFDHLIEKGVEFKDLINEG
jgi:hypothetical protein